MTYDLAYRYQQALDPAGLETIGNALHALEAAIIDCRNAGVAFEDDPAVLLLARHLGAVATQARPTGFQLRRACLDQIAALRRTPALLAIARRGVAFDDAAKTAFHGEGRKALRRLAEALGLSERDYDVRSNKGGRAASGEITLHGEEVYVQLSLDCRSMDREILFRRVDGRKDYLGDRNRWTSVRELLAPDRFASRLREELALTPPIAAPVRLFA
jgi:hypothetical protein